MDKKEIRVGDLVFYLKDISEKVYDGIVQGINEDGTYRIHDETSGGTYSRVPAEKVYTERSVAEARNQADFWTDYEAYMKRLESVQDLIEFMYFTDLGIHDIGTDWAARKAVKDKAKALLDIEIHDIVDGK